ncbi:MAG: exodeoxyribonuclease VII small subunit [Planctomycetes bacterium]|nr:exodeoxyribonuclease VII small subunit [Planctomycetota bacterium]
MGKKPTFEKNLETLEQIVEELESGTLTLEEALERYERGVAAHKECAAILAAAEKRIEVLLKNADGTFGTAPLEGKEGSAREDAT